jgi:GMP synthase (glutamine-hydrolysing)
MSLSRILIIDYGSQLTQLIAKRIRELQCYSEIYPFDYDFSKLNFDDYCGIIFSGAPYTSTDKDAPPF